MKIFNNEKVNLYRSHVAGGNRVGSVLEDRARLIEARTDELKRQEYELAEQERRLLEDKTPLSIGKWVANEYFCGSFASGMYPKLKDLVKRVYEDEVHEILLAGATRYGKTTLAMALQGYSQYLVSCLARPQRTFRLIEESPILFLNTNTTDLKARAAYFSKYSAWIRSTPYFVREYPVKPTVITSLIFPKNVIARFSGAHKNASESEDLIFYVGDEVNLYDVVEKSKRSVVGDTYDAAEAIDSNVSTRMAGTFMNSDGSFPAPCKLIWLCKETYPNSFMRRKIKAVRRLSKWEQRKFLIVESTEWGMKPVGTYEQKFFWVKTATRMESAQIIEDEKVVKEVKRQAEMSQSADVPEDEKFQVVDVPLVHLNAAKKNLEDFQRNMIGLPTEAISLFIKNRRLIFNANRVFGVHLPVKVDVLQKLCEHPFSAETTDTTNGIFLRKEAVSRIVELEDKERVWRPIVNPHMERFVHIDAGLTGDAAGFAIGHCAGWIKVVRQSGDDYVQEVAPFCWIDGMLQIRPPPGGQIPFAFLRSLVYMFEKAGFIIGKITCDSFQHVAITQPLIEKGYNVEVVSIDRTPDPYNEVLAAYFESRMSTYSYNIFETEMGQLERIAKGNQDGKMKEKIDHPEKGSKDVSDSVAGVVYQIMMNSAEVQLNPEAIKTKGEAPMKENAKKEGDLQDMFARGDFEGMMALESDPY